MKERDEKHFFYLAKHSVVFWRTEKITVSVSFKCLHILNSFEEVKSFH